MDIFSLLSMIGGLALFLYGMEVLGDGLKKASGGKLEHILEKLTSNKLMAVLLGAGVTAVIQSSSATTVMVVGFVNSGIMKLSQAVGVILGANVGTTVTAWILSLTDVNGSGFFLQLLKPTSFSPILAIIGVCLISIGKKERQKNIGTILIGFAVLMFGMDTMSTAVEPLAEQPEFSHILLMFSNPVLGMLVGLILTAVIQSSSASIGILQALCATGVVSYATAIPIIMGQNVGTCVTALISSAGASKNAKRAALIHLYYNIIKTVAFMAVFYALNAFIHFAFLEEAASALGVAVIHTAFNVAAVIIIFPVSWILEKLAYLTIPETEEEREKEAEKSRKEIQLLDTRFLSTPGFALEQCKNVAVDMADYSREALFLAIQMLDKFDKASADRVVELENIVDHYEDEIGVYLVKLSSRHLTEKDSQHLSVLLHSIGDFERISDHAINIMEAAKEMHAKELDFSRKAREELGIYTGAIKDIINTSVLVFQEEDLKLAAMIEPMEEVIDYLSVEVKKRHMKRLRKGKCTIEMGFILSDIVTNYERVSDHCSNIALSLLQLNEENFEAHEYQEAISSKDNVAFTTEVKHLKERYQLP
ncbi:Na/Pi cotransporter family protein [Suilimivivens aceti]|uniref:Na/Pi cotransporter family protein n=1 Tax=Suilimivivens aceti TaxID=2981774 RepID=A0ABT2T1L2_9FIRM|nr:Na/Pi cotransporter family protein [Suilimivivens aceti]MCU6743871.1 Na/Pi cotransporter family protein [Suilimivivens aceti]SCH41988.1 Phosphate transport system protein phoU homolog [uncultured Clostridium sp.]